MKHACVRRSAAALWASFYTPCKALASLSLAVVDPAHIDTLPATAVAALQYSLGSCALTSHTVKHSNTFQFLSDQLTAYTEFG